MGSGEILVIALIALVVLGPEKLPKLAADIGRWVGRARAMARQLRTQLDQEVHLEELRRLERRAQEGIESSVRIAPPPATAPTAEPPAVTPPTPDAPATPAGEVPTQAAASAATTPRPADGQP